MRFAPWVFLALALAYEVACVHRPTVTAIESRPWPETAPINRLTYAVNEADGVLFGTVEKAEADWLYDDPCGIIASFLRRCDGTSAYKLTIRSETYPKRLYVFVPGRDTLPLTVGTRAVFLWKWTYAYRYQECRAHQAMSAASCPTDQLPAVLSRDAVAAPQDSALVADLFAHKSAR
jgi:hypothetical protein